MESEDYAYCGEENYFSISNGNSSGSSDSNTTTASNNDTTTTTTTTAAATTTITTDTTAATDNNNGNNTTTNSIARVPLYNSNNNSKSFSKLVKGILHENKTILCQVANCYLCQSPRINVLLCCTAEHFLCKDHYKRIINNEHVKNRCPECKRDLIASTVEEVDLLPVPVIIEQLKSDLVIDQCKVCNEFLFINNKHAHKENCLRLVEAERRLTLQYFDLLRHSSNCKVDRSSNGISSSGSGSSSSDSGSDCSVYGCKEMKETIEHMKRCTITRCETCDSHGLLIQEHAINCDADIGTCKIFLCEVIKSEKKSENKE